VLLYNFIIIRIVKHAIGNTVFVNEFGNFLLSEDELHDFFKFILHLWLNSMDINKQVFIFEISFGQIEKESSKSKVNIGFVVLVEIVYKLTVIFDLPSVLDKLIFILFIRFKDFLANLFRLFHKHIKIFISVSSSIFS